MTQMDADERHEYLTGMDRIYRIRVGSAVPADRLYTFRRSGDQSRDCRTDLAVLLDIGYSLLDIGY